MLIIIADDERLIRLSIKSMIEEIAPNKHTFLEARNGQELINIINNNKPNLAFVDINMPLLDGLSAISLCKDKTPNTSWFILTGEAEFHFAKKSMSLGVTDYLLKPLSLDDLTPIIKNTEDKLTNYYIEENNKFSLSALSTLTLLNSGTDLPKDKLYPLTKGEYKCYLFIFDGLDYNDKKNLILEETIEKLNIFMTKFLVNEVNFLLPYMYNNCIAMLVKSDLKLNINFSELLSQSKDLLYTITILESSPYKDLLEIYNTLKKLYEYSSIRALLGIGELLNINTILKKYSNDFFYLSNYIVDICNAYNKKDELLYKDKITQINSNIKLKNIFNEVNKESLKTFLYFNINYKLDINNDLNCFCNDLLHHASNIFLSSSKVSSSRLVDEIIEYVNLNYMNDIGVNTIAELYNITPNYLSKIFHNKSGLKFSDYITKVRVQEGKKMLLANPSMTVKMVSEKVGYYSSRNFTKQFFKIFGIYPSDLLK